MMTPSELAQQFVSSYFLTLQKSKMELINFYTDNSLMTYGGESYKGLAEISERLEGLGFQTVRIHLDFN